MASQQGDPLCDAFYNDLEAEENREDRERDHETHLSITEFDSSFASSHVVGSLIGKRHGRSSRRGIRNK